MDYIINTKEIAETDKSRPAERSEEIHSKEDKNAEERNMDKSGRHSSGGSDGDKRRCGGNNRFCRRNGSRNGSEHLEH